MSTFRMEYEGKMVTVEELAAIRRAKCAAFPLRVVPGKIPAKPVIPIPPYSIEVMWNREFDFRPYGSGSSENLKVATTLADDLLNMGDGASVKKTRVVDSECQVVYAYGKPL